MRSTLPRARPAPPRAWASTPRAVPASKACAPKSPRAPCSALSSFSRQPANALTRYSLVTRWDLDAPIERVWAALAEPTGWPRWWRYVEAVAVLEKGDAHGVGAR